MALRAFDQLNASDLTALLAGGAPPASANPMSNAGPATPSMASLLLGQNQLSHAPAPSQGPDLAALAAGLNNPSTAPPASTTTTTPLSNQGGGAPGASAPQYQSQTTALLTALLHQQQQEDQKKAALIQQLNNALNPQPAPSTTDNLALLLQQKQIALANNNSASNANPLSLLTGAPQIHGAPATNLYGGPSHGGQLDAVAIAKLLQSQHQSPQFPQTAHQQPQASLQSQAAQQQQVLQQVQQQQQQQLPQSHAPQTQQALPGTASVVTQTSATSATPPPMTPQVSLSAPSENAAAAALAAQLGGGGNATTALLDSAAALSLPVDRRRKGRTGTFPQKLHQMLSDLERQDGGTDIASFLPHGRAFAIHKPRDFVKHVMPKYFRMSRFSSFQRQLNLYDFQRITEGPDKGSYYHELFVQGRPILSTMMKRNKIKGVKNQKQSDKDEEEEKVEETNSKGGEMDEANDALDEEA